MIFFDINFLCGDELTASVTPNSVDDIETVEIGHMYCDDLYMTHDTSLSMNIVQIPQEWDWDTIMHAKFNGNTQAGNMDFMLETVTGALIKRRRKDEFDWITLEYHDIYSEDDFNIKFVDKTGKVGMEYEYAFVPILNYAEGNYNITNAIPKTDRLVILDVDATWSTSLTDMFLDTTRTYASTPTPTLNAKYPYITRNTIANFDTVNVSNATFLPTDEDECKYIEELSEEKNFPFITMAAKIFIDFLTNDKTKIIKASDGRIWLCWVNDGITDNADQVHYLRRISFSATEIGEVENQEDLWNAGFLPKLPEEYL